MIVDEIDFCEKRSLNGESEEIPEEGSEGDFVSVPDKELPFK